MSDPSVDPEKGITGLKEEEKVVHQFKHLIKVMCVKRLMGVYPVLFFVTAMFGALSFYRQTHIWLPALFLSACAIFNFWNCRRMKHAYIQHNTLASADSDLSTTLLASSKK